MPTLYIDCTRTATSRIGTGIQRVVRNIARHAAASGISHGYQVRLVALRNNRYCEIELSQFKRPTVGAALYLQLMHRGRTNALKWIDMLRSGLSRLSGSPAWRDFIHAPRYRFGLAWCALLPLSLPLQLFAKVRSSISGRHSALPAASARNIHADDMLLLADSTWDSWDIAPAVRYFKEQGGYVAAVVYDLIPFSHPQFFLPPLVSAYRSWMTSSIGLVDHYACISRSTENQLNAFLDDAGRHGRANRPATTSHFILGSDLDLVRTDVTHGARVAEVIADGCPAFLVVGSIEPRKNLGYVIDAFDSVWRDGGLAKLIVVGHSSWKTDALMKRLKRHPLRGRKLFWLRNIGDNDLAYLYQRSTALVFPSVAEGFGLPIVEAMQRGLPVICSDIPVFREIADGRATFINPLDPGTLSAAVLRHLADKPARSAYSWPSWQDSTMQLVAALVARHQGRSDRSTDC